MGQHSALKAAFLKNFQTGNVECLLERQAKGKDYELVFIFLKAQSFNHDYSEGIHSVLEPVLKTLKERGLDADHSTASGFSSAYGGYYISLNVPESELHVAKTIQLGFSKSIG